MNIWKLVARRRMRSSTLRGLYRDGVCDWIRAAARDAHRAERRSVHRRYRIVQTGGVGVGVNPNTGRILVMRAGAAPATPPKWSSTA